MAYKSRPACGRLGRHPADDAGVLDQLTQDLAGQDAFGGIDQEKVGTGFQAGSLQDGRHQIGGGARRRSGFEHHQVALAQHREDGLGRGSYGAHVGQLVFLAMVVPVGVLKERRRRRNDKGVGFFGFFIDTQVAAVQRSHDRLTQAGLMDVNLPLAQGRQDVGVDVHPDHTDAVGGKGAGGGQANITQAEDADFVYFHADSQSTGYGIVKS